MMGMNKPYNAFQALKTGLVQAFERLGGGTASKMFDYAGTSMLKAAMFGESDAAWTTRNILQKKINSLKGTKFNPKKAKGFDETSWGALKDKTMAKYEAKMKGLPPALTTAERGGELLKWGMGYSQMAPIKGLPSQGNWKVGLGRVGTVAGVGYGAYATVGGLYNWATGSY